MKKLMTLIACTLMVSATSFAAPVSVSDDVAVTAKNPRRPGPRPAPRPHPRPQPRPGHPGHPGQGGHGPGH